MGGEKVFITGVTGFVGRNLAEYLYCQGFIIYGLVRNKLKFLNANIPFVYPIYGDLNDINKWENNLIEKSYIIHAAGLISSAREKYYYEVNSVGTKNLVNAVLKNNPFIKKFLYISSLAVAGCSNSVPRTENDEPQPISHYGKSKLLAEKEAEKLMSKLTILRPPVIFGPYDKGMLMLFRYVLKYGIAPIVRGNNSKVDFLFIDDFTRACYDALLSRNTLGKKYYLGGNPLDWKQFWQLVHEASGKKLKYISLPVLVVKALGFINDIFSNSMLNSDKTKEIICPNWTSSCEMAQKDFDFCRQTDNLTAIRKTLLWYQRKNWI